MILVAESNILLGFRMTHSNTFGFRGRENIPFQLKGNILFDPKCFISEK